MNLNRLILNTIHQTGASWLPVLFTVSWYLTRTVGLNLDGTPGSYIQYPGWKPCANGSLSVEFKTSQEQALLLYFNKGEYLFFELKLLKGMIRLRVGVDEMTEIIRGGHSLNDGKWHKVEIIQNGDETSLVVDSVTNSKATPGLSNNLLSTSSVNQTLVFIGGLPEEYNAQKFRTLALQSVIFEPRFRGSVRNLFYRNCGGEPFRPHVVKKEGILTRDEDLCERGNPCLNGGQCLTTDNGLYCDCLETEYKGDRCEIQKIPSDATFLGAQYISYNLSTLVSNQDRITLDFRTKQPSSLLFYTGDHKDHITVGLVDGVIFVTVNLGSGMIEMEIRPRHESFDDNRWHQLVISRDAREVTVEVDGMHKQQSSTTGKFVQLSSSLIYVAGSPDTQTLPGSRVRTNFKGCMRKVKYHADSVRLDLTEMARRQHGLLRVTGDIIFDKCQELVDTQPVTFSTPESHLVIETWNRPSLKGSLAFQFRTVEEGGLIMYSNGNRDSHDFFALEILDGHLYLVLDMGSGVLKLHASKMPVTDGRPHDVYFEFTENKGYITVDGQKESFASPLISDRFDLHGELYVGGVGPAVNMSNLPHELWSATLGHSFVGCLQDLVVNNKLVDLTVAARASHRTDIQGHCHRSDSECSSHPCNHGGRCVEGWNRFSCDCRATGFVGNVCQTATATLIFDGTEHVKILMPKESRTQAEDISIRFRTMHKSGLLFQTTAARNSDSLKLYLEDGNLYLSIEVGQNDKTLSVGHTLHDDRWHTVFIKRREHTIQLSIDLDRPVTDQVRGRSSTLSVREISVGHLMRDSTHHRYRRKSKRERSLSSNHVVDDLSGFVGSLQAFVFNGDNFFEMAESESGHHMDITAKFSSDEYVVREPVTFKSVDSYAVLPTLQVHEEFSVSFQIKTTESEGLLMYNAGKGRDFFAMELHNGFLYYVYNMGEGAQRVKANINKPINDNKWHEIRLLRTNTFKQLLRVDANTPTEDDLSGNRNVKFDLDGSLYIGGVRKTMYPSLPKLIQARSGFVGCLGSLDLNSYLPSLLRDAKPIHESVGDGCQGPLKKCVNDSCAHHGRCVQQWTSYNCDCDLTSYTGSMCHEESISYKFGPGLGLMTFTYPEDGRPSTNSESLAFGFRTYQEDAVLLRMDSVTYDDFIQIELTEGSILVTYNMGTLDHPLGGLFTKLNDGKYHVIRFTRDGPNSTLTIDFDRPLTKFPAGRQAHTFNNQAYIRVGGKAADDGSILENFEGSMSGLVINGIHLFERAMQKDSRIHLTGSVQISHIPKSNSALQTGEYQERMQSTEATVTPSDYKLPKHFRWNKHLDAKSKTIKSTKIRKRVKKHNREPVHYSYDENNYGRNGRKDPKNESYHYDRVDTGTRQNDQAATADSEKDTWNFLQEILTEGLSKVPSFVDEERDKATTTDSPYGNNRNAPDSVDCESCGGPMALTKRPDERSGRSDPFFGHGSVDDKPDDLLDDTPRGDRWNHEMRDDDRFEPSKSGYPYSDYEDDDFDNELSGNEGSGYGYEEEKPWYSNSNSNPHDANRSPWSNWSNRMHGSETTTSIITPYRSMTQHPPARQFAASRHHREEWNYLNGHTTPREGVTDEILYAGSGCQYDDEDDCSHAGSGNDGEIIQPVVIPTTTTPAPTTPSTTTTTTTTRRPANTRKPYRPPCEGPDCEVSSKLLQTTSDDKVTAQPGKTVGGDDDDDDDDDKGINLALILGITGSVLLAIIVLVIALYKLRSRDEGTYKVDETQNFSNLQSKKSNGNGALMAGADAGTGKRGKKKDVKEWYV